MRTILFTLLALTCMLLSSCNNELDEQQVAITDETNTVFRQSDGILMFDNEAAFVISNFACTTFGNVECTENGNMACT